MYRRLILDGPDVEMCNAKWERLATTVARMGSQALGLRQSFDNSGQFERARRTNRRLDVLVANGDV